MVNKEVLQKRIEKANEYMDFLQDVQKYSKQEFMQDKMVYGSIERFLHLSIETLIDIGNHIISDENLGRVDSYRDIPELLCKNEYIDKDLRELFIKVIGFRNILVHDYMELDREIVYEILKNDLTDLRDILKAYGSFL